MIAPRSFAKKNQQEIDGIEQDYLEPPKFNTSHNVKAFSVP